MTTSKIKKVIAREILDSRGNPTVEVDVLLTDNSLGRASVPSGASTGDHEALELRDGDNKRYGGKGVLKAVANIQDKIFPKIKGLDANKQNEIDKAMIKLDGTTGKKKLGANAILGVSLAVARACALSTKKPLYNYLAFSKTKANKLPVPMFNILNGGAHTSWQSTDIQEFMICPIGAKNFREALRWGSEVYHELKSLLKEKKYSVNVGDEGGFAPKLKDNAEAVKLILMAIKKAGYQAGEQIAIALDVAASELYEQGHYRLHTENKKMSHEEIIKLYQSWLKKYPIISIEDGLAQDDWAGWQLMNKKIGHLSRLVGDDLFVTNTERIQQGIEESSANSVLIKLNQIGSLSETIAAIQMTQKAGWEAIISHRSGETSDSFIADLAVASGSNFIKTGAPCRSERLEKYNQLLRIEEELGPKATYAGQDILRKIKF